MNILLVVSKAIESAIEEQMQSGLSTRDEIYELIKSSLDAELDRISVLGVSAFREECLRNLSDRLEDIEAKTAKKQV